MTCVLRAAGTALDVAAFLADSPIKPDATYRKGDRFGRPQADGRTRTSSGFDVTLSHAGFDDLDGEIRDAIVFLDEHEDELRRLGSFVGVEIVCLEFGIRRRDVAVQTDVFPSDLLWRAGALDIALAITHYPISEPQA